MKKIVIFLLLILLLIGCAILPRYGVYMSSFSAEMITTDYFEEWGLIRSTAHGVVVKKNGLFEPTDSSFNNACVELFGGTNFYAGRIYQDEASGKMTMECFTQFSVPASSGTLINQLMNKFLSRTANVWIQKDSVYHVLYGGDSLQVVSGAFSNHKKVCSEKESAKCVFNDDFEKKKEEMYFDGPFYEISLPAIGRVRSLTISRNQETIKYYSPLKLATSILPLESPGYKKLREYEESLMSRE